METESGIPCLDLMSESPTRLSDERGHSTTLLERIDRTIHPRCEMYGYARTQLENKRARAYYFETAHELVVRLQAVLEEQGTVLKTSSLLDFASGYGRFTRFFVHLFREVQVSDLEPEMLAYASRRFGVDGFLSSTDPAALSNTRRFDVVFCFSLFTHLPASVWIDWLGALAGLVNEGGLLVFSTRSPALATSLAVASRSGGRAPVAYMEGIPHTVISSPFQPEERKSVSLYGVRVTADPGAEGVVEIRVPVISDAHWWVEQTFLEPVTVAGLSLGPVSAEPDGTPGEWGAVRFRIPLSVQAPLRDVAIGRVTTILRFRRPAVIQVENPESGTRVAGRQPDCRFVPAEEISGQLESMSDGSIATKDGSADPVASQNGAFEPGPCGGGQPDFLFEPTNETSGRLEPASYGSTTVTDDFVRRAASQVGTLELVRHFPGGELDDYQDIYFFRRR